MSRNVGNEMKHRYILYNSPHGNPNETYVLNSKPKSGQLYRARIILVYNYGCYIQLTGTNLKFAGLISYMDEKLQDKLSSLIKRGHYVSVQLLKLTGVRLMLELTILANLSLIHIVFLSKHTQVTYLQNSPLKKFIGSSHLERYKVFFHTNSNHKTSPQMFELKQLLSARRLITEADKIASTKNFFQS